MLSLLINKIELLIYRMEHKFHTTNFFLQLELEQECHKVKE
jgi:hypothetical protein